MILFRDYKTANKSLSVTGLILTFLLVVIGIVGAALQKINENLLWFILAFHGSYIAIYWNKRVRGAQNEIETGANND